VAHTRGLISFSPLGGWCVSSRPVLPPLARWHPGVFLQRFSPAPTLRAPGVKFTHLYVEMAPGFIPPEGYQTPPKGPNLKIPFIGGDYLENNMGL